MPTVEACSRTEREQCKPKWSIRFGGRVSLCEFARVNGGEKLVLASSGILRCCPVVVRPVVSHLFFGAHLSSWIAKFKGTGINYVPQSAAWQN